LVTSECTGHGEPDALNYCGFQILILDSLPLAYSVRHKMTNFKVCEQIIKDFNDILWRGRQA